MQTISENKSQFRQTGIREMKQELCKRTVPEACSYATVAWNLRLCQTVHGLSSLKNLPSMEFKDGNILSLTVKDFQTFAAQRFTFGPSLNLIAAPNGSGKSSIANAIAFVLNGTPKTVGKSKDIAEFIRFGCSEAEILAEVFSGGRVVELSRKIAIGHNRHFIDGELVTQREYFELLGRLNIDVNNMCTFLPQERVGEFCRMDGRELLVEMLKNTKIDLTRVKGLHSSLEKVSAALSSAERKKELVENTINVLESGMRQLREREENALRVQKLEYKKLFLEYEVCKSQYLSTKKEIASLGSKVQENAAKMDSCERRIRERESYDVFLEYTRGVETLLSQNRELASIYDSLRSLTLKLEMLKSDREALANRSIQRRKSVENKAREAEEMKRQLDTTRSETYKRVQEFKSRILDICKSTEYKDMIVPDSAIMSREVTTMEELEALAPSLKTIEDKCQNLRQSIAQIQSTSHRIQKHIESLEQQKIAHSEQGSVRMEMLKKYHHDTYKGVLWLRENTHMFRDEVLEPCYLHLSLDKEYSDYVETFLSFQALSSFITKNDDDFGKLTRVLKDEMGLSINAAVLGSRRVPGLPREELERFGLEGVLSDFIECRPEYMDFLNSYGHFNSIPIAKKEIREDKVFSGLPLVKRMAAGGRYSEIKKSRYGSDYVIVTSRVSGKGLFAFPKIDIEHINLQLADLNKERERNKSVMERILEEKVAMEARRVALRKELDTSHIGRLFFLEKRLAGNIVFIENEIEMLSKADDEASIDRIDISIAQTDKEILKESERLHALLDPANIPAFNLEKVKDLRLDLDNDRRSFLFLQHLKETDEANLDRLKSTKEAVKAKIEDLKQQIASFPKLDSLDGLPDTIPELEGEIAFFRAKLDIAPGQSHTKEDCREKESQLNAIFEDISDLQRARAALEEELSLEKARVAGEIHCLLSPVNEKFRGMFRRLGFEGRLELDTTGEEWELKVLVGFRDGESLQRLSSFRQSGGEKSLTTILLLLALQQCEDVPFRLVDEINQGMDPYNEKAVFEILREMGSRSQFFIITPKLVEGLEFSESTRVLIVYGGPDITKDLESYARAVLGPANNQ